MNGHQHAAIERARIAWHSHQFTIDRDGQVVATVSKRWLTVTASYAVEVAPGEDDLLILASVLALDLAIDAEHDH